MKKRIFLFCSLTLMSTCLIAQDYQQVDKIVKTYPTSIVNADDLIKLINNDFTRDVDKARAIFTWIALNIDYDVEASSLEETFSYKTKKSKISTENKIREKWGRKTMASGKAECEGYATLYYYLCALIPIECVVIPGTSKISLDQIGMMPERVNHAWNAIKIDSEWKFVDVTWAAGDFDHILKTFNHKFDDTYFLVSPERFFLEHYPHDHNFLFVNKTKENFAELPLFYWDYIRSDYELISPRSGILLYNKNGVVKFLIKSYKGVKEISYTFDDEWLTNKITVNKIGELYEIEVPFSADKVKFLTLYYQNRGLMTFKITE